MAIPELLHRLLSAAGPSGVEDAPLAVWREAASRFAEVREDPLGGLIAVPAGDGPLVALVAHVDEIGFIVTHLTEHGLLCVGSVGGWRPETLVAQRVRIATRDGVVDGVCCRAQRAARKRATASR